MKRRLIIEIETCNDCPMCIRTSGGEIDNRRPGVFGLCMKEKDASGRSKRIYFKDFKKGDFPKFCQLEMICDAL